MIWWRPELRVLFVCTANVCRSPLAEAMLRQRLRVRKLAQEAGFTLGRIRARQVTARMLRDHDFVLAMEVAHLEELAALALADPDRGKAQLLGHYRAPGRGGDAAIPDPYFSDMQGFNEVFALIDEALDGLIGQLQLRLESP